MCSVHPVFHMSMLEPTTSNTFSERIQLAPAPVIIDGEPEYEISQIVDSKIDRWQACKLLYKVIWLGYEILEMNPNKSLHPNSLMPPTWYLISTSHILPSPVLFHCSDHTVTFVPCLCAFPMGILFINFLVYSVHLFSLTLSFCAFFGVFFSKLSNFFSF